MAAVAPAPAGNPAVNVLLPGVPLVVDASVALAVLDVLWNIVAACCSRRARAKLTNLHARRDLEVPAMPLANDARPPRWSRQIGSPCRMPVLPDACRQPVMALNSNPEPLAGITAQF